jgi:hypothetical protein
MNLVKPHYVYRLRQFDESNPSKITSQAVTPRSVVGIGGKGTLSALLLTWDVFTISNVVEKPDYSEAKIVLAMVLRMSNS